MNKRSSIEGFVPRRGSGGLSSDGVHQKLPPAQVSNFQRRSMMPTPEAHGTAQNNGLKVVARHGLSRSDIDESLKQIDTGPQPGGQTGKHHVRGVNTRRRKIIKRIIIALIVVLVGTGLFIAVKALIASSSVFKGDLFGLVQQKKLKQDQGGRSNILILGTSEDDPGHEGSYLTDSIMLLSVNQTTKDAYMISIPRDLPVQYGKGCDAGYAGKINAYFNCVNGDWTSDSAETERQDKTREFIGDILGIDIQYSVHVNYSVMRDVVGALGGITVNIESTDPRGQMDANFDWKCGATYSARIKNCPPRGHFIDYPNGPVELDAEHALYLAQARGDVANWGFSRSNFDREQNQQKIIKAIREKALSGGTLANPIKVSNLIDALGKNLRTNFETGEIGTLVSLAKAIPNNSINSVDLEKDGIMTGDAVPAAGLYNYTQLRSYLQKKLYATDISKEGAHVVVLNASGIAGAAQIEADKLEALGMTVDAVDNAPEDQSYKTNKIYQVGAAAKAKTATKLSSLYHVSPTVTTSVPEVTYAASTDYIIVIVNVSGTSSSSAN